MAKIYQEFDQLARLQNKEQQILLQSIIDHTKAGLVLARPICDAEGQIVDFRYVLTNAQNAHIARRTMAELNNALIGDVFPGWQATDFFQIFVRVAQTGQTIQSVFPFDDQGIKGWFDGSFSRVDDCVLYTYLDVTALKEAELRAKQQADLLGNIQNISKLGIAAYSAIRDEVGAIIDFKPIWRNAESIRMTGASEADAQSVPIAELMPTLKQTSLIERYKEVMESGQPLQFEHHHVKSGVERWYDITAQPFDGGILVNVLETTELRRAERDKLEKAEELELANFELKRSNESLQSFAYLASHDLQEPLRKITSFSDILFNKYAAQFDPNATDLLRRMNDSALRMRQLIQDLLTYSRVETHREPHRPVDLVKLTNELRENELWEAFYRSKAQLDLVDLPVVKADPFQMRQLFQNLLSNAIKFTSPGTTPAIRIKSQLLDRSEVPAGLLSPLSAETDQNVVSDRYYQIDVTDNGIGFDPRHEDRVFQIFQRLNNRSQYEGTGIGLAICKKIMERHDGAITVRSEVGKGSTFSVYLPCA